MDSLTRRQQEILTHLRANREIGAPAPTLDELCQALGLSSRGSLHKHIQALTEAGAIEPMNHQQRGVRLTQENAGHNELTALPYLGKIAAGRPIEAIANPASLDVPSWMCSTRPCYVLRVAGDLMIDAGILDDDYVVIKQCDHADNDQIVVALIDNHEATLKSYRRQAGRIVLSPANQRLEPMTFDPARVIIQGILIGQMRRYR